MLDPADKGAACKAQTSISRIETSFRITPIQAWDGHSVNERINLTGFCLLQRPWIRHLRIEVVSKKCFYFRAARTESKLSLG